MELLQSLQEAIVDSSRSLTDSLRLAKILAARLQHTPLKEWVDFELDGYPKDGDVPAYRKADISLRGHFIGPAGMSSKNAHIPHGNLVSAVGRKLADQWRTMSIRQGIAECEHLIGQKGELRVQVPPEMIRLIGSNVYEHMSCMDAFAWLSAGTLRGLVDSVRNRLLTFVLDLETSHGVTIKDQNWRSVPAGSITQIFNNSILRDVAAGAHISQTRE